MTTAMPPQRAENIQAARAVLRLLYIAHHQGPAAANKELTDVPSAELPALTAFALGCLWSATVDLADLHGVPVEQFLRTFAFNIETTPGVN